MMVSCGESFIRTDGQISAWGPSTPMNVHGRIVVQTTLTRAIRMIDIVSIGATGKSRSIRNGNAPSYTPSLLSFLSLVWKGSWLSYAQNLRLLHMLIINLEP
jgi:hypothetical protein